MYMNDNYAECTRTHKASTHTSMKIICNKCKLGKYAQGHVN